MVLELYERKYDFLHSVFRFMLSKYLGLKQHYKEVSIYLYVLSILLYAVQVRMHSKFQNTYTLLLLQLPVHVYAECLKAAPCTGTQNGGCAQ